MGIVHRVIARTAPDVRVIDVTHSIPPHDVTAGALTLWRSIAWMAPAVVLAVVDPGVGTTRRPVAITTGSGVTLVGPDNGLLVPAAHVVGPIASAVLLRPPTAPLIDRTAAGPVPPASGPVTPASAPFGVGSPGMTPGVTFDGRDVFAPAAARIAAGADPTTLGDPIDPAGLVGQAVPMAEPLEGERGWKVTVLWVDHFGNAQLNCPAAVLPPISTLRLGPDGPTLTLRLVRSFAALGPGGVGLVTDSYGLAAICMDGRSAASTLSIEAGQVLFLRASA